MKYVVITGGVISGVGKGIIASSTGVLLRAMTQRVSAIKIDPYLNVDAGTLSPLDHGEVFVLEDGGEVDLDLGNYERFLDVTLTRDNNITLGKLYERIIQKERRGDFLGKTVQVVPHVTDAVQDWIERVAAHPVHLGARASGDSDERPDVCIIELGGTIGDLEGAPFVEALRQFQFRVGRENFFLIHVSLVPLVGGGPGDGGEQKSRPTQSSVRDLRSAGLSPDVIACRSSTQLSAGVRDKISLFCQVPANHIMAVHDCESVYHVPMLLASQGLDAILASRLGLVANASIPRPLSIPATELHDTDYFVQWTTRARNLADPQGNVTVAIVGKYTFLHDSYISIIKALNHAAMASSIHVKLVWIEATDLEELSPDDGAERAESFSRVSSSINGTPLLQASRSAESVDEELSMALAFPAAVVAAPGSPRYGMSALERHSAAWDTLRGADALIVPGGFGERGTEGKLAAIKHARTTNTPFLGICLGFQLAVIEHARNILGLQGANSVELDSHTPHPVVVNMPEVSSVKLGGTMRLGARDTIFVEAECKSRTLYANAGITGEVISERHRHRYEVNPEMVDQLASNGMLFVGKDVETKSRMEILERVDHPFFVGVQFHPEFLSRPLRPAPLFLGLVMAASEHISRDHVPLL